VKKLASLLFFFLMTACGAIDNIPCYVDGIKCHEEQGPPQSTETTVEKTVIVKGSVGPRGNTGATGSPSTIPGPKGDVGDSGSSCSILDTAYGADITCGIETIAIFDGSDGNDGIAGTSCSILDTLAGATIFCGLDSVAILDGEDGADAPFAISEVVDPCSDGPGHDEVILVFATGEWVAWYVGLGLSILTPGATYQTSDAQACIFTVPN